MGSDYAIKDLVPLILTQGLEITELGKHPRNEELLFLNSAVEFTLLKWYNSQYLLFRNVKSCLRGNSYIHDKLENNLKAIYKIYTDLQAVGAILRQFRT